jgi:hypothetical protein
MSFNVRCILLAKVYSIPEQAYAPYKRKYAILKNELLYYFLYLCIRDDI